jgi:hypothetical protein
VVCRDAVFHRASWLFDSNFEVVLIFNSVIPKQKLIRRAFAAEHVLISTSCTSCLAFNASIAVGNTTG